MNKTTKNSEKWQNFLQPSSLSFESEKNLISFTSGTNIIDLIKFPIITEKSYLALSKYQQYTFDVDLRLTKTQIKKLFEQLLQVNVIAINTHIPPRKNLRVGTTKGYRVRYKRAILTLKKGESLKFSIPLTV